jgi:hypothetical protein
MECFDSAKTRIQKALGKAMPNTQNTIVAAAGHVACAPMRDAQTLEKTIQALLTAKQHSALAIGGEYDDASIELILYRADRTDDNAMNLAKAGEGLLCRLDDMRDNTGPEWDAASLAVDPFVV